MIYQKNMKKSLINYDYSNGDLNVGCLNPKRLLFIKYSLLQTRPVQVQTHSLLPAIIHDMVRKQPPSLNPIDLLWPSLLLSTTLPGSMTNNTFSLPLDCWLLEARASISCLHVYLFAEVIADHTCLLDQTGQRHPCFSITANDTDLFLLGFAGLWLAC